jgi:single-strand DNA-binding protein
MDTNKVILIGRLTRDAELKYTANNKALANFAIAVSGYSKDDVSFFDVRLWGQAAEKLNQYLVKGK